MFSPIATLKAIMEKAMVEASTPTEDYLSMKVTMSLLTILLGLISTTITLLLKLPSSKSSNMKIATHIRQFQIIMKIVVALLRS